MTEVRASVVRVAEGKAWVKPLERNSGCGRCHEPGGCHAPQFAEMFRSSEGTFAVDDPLGLKAGERIKIMIDDGVPLRAALSSYGLGTGLALLGAALGVWLAPAAQADGAALAGFALGVVATALILRLQTRRRGASVWKLHIERDTAGQAAAGCMGSCG